jgi:hypothetical protein
VLFTLLILIDIGFNSFNYHQVGVCLSDDPEMFDNSQPVAPLPCADAVFNISGGERGRGGGRNVRTPP